MSQTGTLSNVVETTVNYFPANGETFVYAGTAGYQRREFDSCKVQITDIRGKEEEYTLERHGFQVVREDWTQVDSDEDPKQIEAVLFPEAARILQKLTGASKVVPYSQLIRKATAEQLANEATGREDSDILKTRGPSRFVHCDTSEAGAPIILAQNVGEEEAAARKQHRWAILNIWRPISRPANREPLALMDGRTVREGEVVGVFASIPKGKGGYGNLYSAGGGWEMGQILASEEHKWYYVSNLGLDEAIVFKQFDSKKDGRARRAPHTSIEGPNDFGPARQSVELRALVFWDDDTAE